MRFIATADWQLGMAAHFLESDERARFHHARFEVLSRICSLATEREAQFIVVCGDVFESNQLDRKVIARTFDALEATSVPIYLLPGNHDPLDRASIYHSAEFVRRKPDHVHVIEDSHPITVAEGIEIVGAPWFSKHPVSDLAGDAIAPLSPAPDGVVRILACHGAVDTLSPDRDSLSAIRSEVLNQALDDGVLHAVMIGDRHSLTNVGPRIWYPGAPEVTSRREQKPGYVLEVDVDATTCQVQPHPVGQWTFRTVEAPLNSAEDVQSLTATLEQIENKSRTGIWLALTGTLSVADHALYEQMLHRLSPSFALLQVWESHTQLAVMPDDHDFSDLHLAAFAHEGVQELMAVAAGDGQHAQTAQRALALLYRCAGGGQ